MGKKKRERFLTQKEANASIKGLRGSPQKLNLLAKLIRGKPVGAALDYLIFSKKRASNYIYKLLISAINNAENNHSLDIDKLYISEAFVGKGVYLKRMHQRARGRASKILKPFSHFYIVVKEKEVK